MTWSVVNNGTQVSGFNVTLNPAMPSGVAAGNLLTLVTGEYIGTDPTPSVSGWTLLSPGVHAKQIAIFGRIAAGGDTASITWAANSLSWAFTAAYASSNAIATLSGMVALSVDLASTNTAAIAYSPLSGLQSGNFTNCLILMAGQRNKLAASNGGSFNTPNFGSFNIRYQAALNGTSNAFVLNDWIQTTATDIAGGTQNYTSGDGAQNQESIIVALLPPAPPATLISCPWVSA